MRQEDLRHPGSSELRVWGLGCLAKNQVLAVFLSPIGTSYKKPYTLKPDLTLPLFLQPRDLALVPRTLGTEACALNPKPCSPAPDMGLRHFFLILLLTHGFNYVYLPWRLARLRWICVRSFRKQDGLLQHLQQHSTVYGAVWP